jgi:hypothetical protein
VLHHTAGEGIAAMRGRHGFDKCLSQSPKPRLKLPNIRSVNVILGTVCRCHAEGCAQSAR